jgi:hypothetical protein
MQEFAGKTPQTKTATTVLRVPAFYAKINRHALRALCMRGFTVQVKCCPLEHTDQAPALL